MSLLLVDGALVIGMAAPDDVTKNGKVLVDGTRIRALHGEAVRLAAQAEARGERVERLDASGLWLLPGFVQTHIHLCQTLLRNGPDDLELLPWLSTHVWPGEAALDPATLEVSARLGLAELAAGGTTAVLDMGTVRHTDAVFRAAEASGLRVTSGNALMDHPGTCPPYLFAPGDEGLEETARLAGRWHGTAAGRLRVAYCPRFAVSCTDRTLEEAGGRARARGLLVHTHASENGAEVDIVRRRTGRANVRFLADVGISGPGAVLAHVIHTGEDERELLASEGTGVAHCPSSNLKLGSGLCPVPEYLGRGIRVTLGADGAPCNDRLDPFTEMRLAALLPKVRLGPSALTAWDVVRMATVDGARALGLGDVCGRIAPGLAADFVLLDPLAGWALPQSWRDDPYGPIVFSFDRSHVVATYVDGAAVYRRGTPHGPSPAEVNEAARTLAARRADLTREEAAP